VIAIFTFLLTNFVIPHANLNRITFEDKYYRPSRQRIQVMNIHRQIHRNVYVYMESFNPISLSGRNFTIEKFDEEGLLQSKFSSVWIRWDTVAQKWTAGNYLIREMTGNGEIITKGLQIDTALTIRPEDLARDPSFVGTMTYNELNDYINLLELQSSDEIKLFLIEKHRRLASPFAVFILTLIGVSLSSRKVRGGIGMNIGVGLALSFTYILFLQFSSQFSLKGNLDPMLANWIPNIIYSVIALALYRIAPK